MIGLEYTLLGGTVTKSGTSCPNSYQLPPGGVNAGKLVGFAGVIAANQPGSPSNYIRQDELACFFMCESPRFSALSYVVYKHLAIGSLSTISFYNVPCQSPLNLSVSPPVAFITLSQVGSQVAI